MKIPVEISVLKEILDESLYNEYLIDSEFGSGREREELVDDKQMCDSWYILHNLIKQYETTIFNKEDDNGLSYLDNKFNGLKNEALSVGIRDTYT